MALSAMNEAEQRSMGKHEENRIRREKLHEEIRTWYLEDENRITEMAADHFNVPYQAAANAIKSVARKQGSRARKPGMTPEEVARAKAPATPDENQLRTALRQHSPGSRKDGVFQP